MFRTLDIIYIPFYNIYIVSMMAWSSKGIPYEPSMIFLTMTLMAYLIT